MIVTLPFPSPRLSPNARQHWRQHAEAKKQARADAHWETLRQLGFKAIRKIAASEGKIELTVRFYPPDRRKRDDDNMVAGFKSLRDGIASAIGVDDNRFKPTYEFGEPEAPGRVEIEIAHG